MDKWETMMQQFMALPEADRIQQIEQSKTMCICKECPSYKDTGESALLFCGTGKSSIITDENGCTCGLCPVIAHMGLTRLYYCTRGNEKDQRDM
jgi:hypothetical protein